MSDKVMVMYQGTIVDRFDKSSIFSEDRHVYTKKLLEVFDPEAFHAEDADKDMQIKTPFLRDGLVIHRSEKGYFYEMVNC